MEITTIPRNKTFVSPTVKQSKFRQFFKKQARNIGLIALGTISLCAISSKSLAQTTPNKTIVDSSKTISSVIDSTGTIHVTASWTRAAGGTYDISQDIAGMADSKIVSEKDTIKKISIPSKINAEGWVVSAAEIFYIFPKGVYEVSVDPPNHLYTLLYCSSPVFNDTVFRNAVYVGRDTAGGTVVLVPSASEVFVFREHKNPHTFYFLSCTHPVNPYWTEDANYAYLHSKAFGKNGDGMYRFSKTDSEADVVYMKKVK